MTKIDIFSGFLGAGKTTLIKKLIAEAFPDEKVVLIENEFGEINIDSGFLKDAGVEITEMSSGCICCTLVGDFAQALRSVAQQFSPDRILIEPSGVGKLSDVIRAVRSAERGHPCHPQQLCHCSRREKMQNVFQKFRRILSRSDRKCQNDYSQPYGRNERKTVSKPASTLLRAHNEKARIITTPWDQLTGSQILEVMEGDRSSGRRTAGRTGEETGSRTSPS